MPFVGCCALVYFWTLRFSRIGDFWTLRLGFFGNLDLRIIHGEHLSAFIFKIAKNQIINRYKSRINSYVFEEYVNYYNEEQCSVSDTSAIVEYDDFCKSLKKAMKNLSSTQREVIECVKLNQMSVKETAVKLRLKEQTVKNALSAGLKVLKEILKKSLVLILSFVLK